MTFNSITWAVWRIDFIIIIKKLTGRHVYKPLAILIVLNCHIFENWANQELSICVFLIKTVDEGSFVFYVQIKWTNLSVDFPFDKMVYFIQVKKHIIISLRNEVSLGVINQN